MIKTVVSGKMLELFRSICDPLSDLTMSGIPGLENSFLAAGSRLLMLRFAVFPFDGVRSNL